MFVLGISELHQRELSEYSPTNLLLPFPFLPLPHASQISLVNHSTCPNQPRLTQDAQHRIKFTETLGKLLSYYLFQYNTPDSHSYSLRAYTKRGIGPLIRQIVTEGLSLSKHCGGRQRCSGEENKCGPHSQEA